MFHELGGYWLVYLEIFGSFLGRQRKVQIIIGAELAQCFDESYRRKFFFEKGNFFDESWNFKLLFLNYYY